MKIIFLNSSDIHGYILPTDYQNQSFYEAPFGLSRVSSVINYERQKYGEDHVVVTDTGDYLQGSPLASYIHLDKTYTALKTYTELTNQIGYDARCLGNHDFNYGLNYLSNYIAANHAPFLNANVLSIKDDQPAFGKNYCIINKAGVRIGLIGVTTQRIPTWEPAQNVTGLKFVSAFEQVKRYAQILRPQVDVLAVIYHGGFEANPLTGKRTEPATGENEGYRILNEIPEIDVFLTGHQHRKINLVMNNTAIVQPGYRGEAIGEVILEIDDATKEILDLSAKLIDTKDFPPDTKINDLASELNQKAQLWLDQPLAHLKQPALIGDSNQARLKGAPFINLLQQMQLFFTSADISATAVMSETAKGFGQEVTMRDILLNYPYANQLCRVRLTGKQLRQIVEYSLSFLMKDEQGEVGFAPKWQDQLFNFDVFYPVKYVAKIDRAVGNRLIKFELNGKAIEDEQVYRLAVNNYRAMGGGFYPAYHMGEIELTLDQDYVQMFKTFLTKGDIQVDNTINYLFK
ncbi:bifunctional UDP-sugar hydrolase/5'-nucleotidase [Lactobacillus sp. ESL0228]|uniref:bifunctional metallophosphatase/5'-nucleotidase n=1 Tax=Lactobacillus sp. ESL0228 TaxID=2069352 RepID=UPI000EFCB9EA|nr:bifunctional UDP-sugar hydrolase/5'-nucleotidase [Lactobacillus sp. ESL0228]RMC48745.1 bifunctional metallophosphatase/5'-nucleotidase [Lactobacillus sp. ESL0228]